MTLAKNSTVPQPGRPPERGCAALRKANWFIRCWWGDCRESFLGLWWVIGNLHFAGGDNVVTAPQLHWKYRGNYGRFTFTGQFHSLSIYCRSILGTRMRMDLDKRDLCTWTQIILFLFQLQSIKLQSTQSLSPFNLRHYNVSLYGQPIQ